MEWNEELMSIVQPEPVNTGLSETVKERARVFGKWLWLYFWVMIASFIIGGIAAVEEMAKTGTIIGTVIGWIGSVVLLVALFKLSAVEERMKTCAGLNAVALAAQIILHFVNSEVLTDLWAIPGSIIGLISIYQFMHGCGDSLLGVDNEQAEKWYGLWKWYVGLGIGGVVGLPLVTVLVVALDNALLVILFVIVMIAWVVALLVQIVREYVYIYRTAKIFRGIAENL